MRIALWMAILIVLENTVGLLLAWRWNLGGRPLSGALVATAVTAFVGLLALNQSRPDRWKLTESVMRSTIAGSMILVYLVLLGIVAFFSSGPEQLPGITQTFVSNFTMLIGVVVAFYFGTSAYVQVKKAEESQATQERSDS